MSIKRSSSLSDLAGNSNVIKKHDSNKNAEALNAQCGICKEILLFPCSLGCGHSFCHGCLKNMHTHIHKSFYNQSHAEPDDDDDDDDVQITSSSSTNVQAQSQTSYRNVFFDDECFKGAMNSKVGRFTSGLYMNKEALTTHILQDSIFCDNCPSLKCPTCRLGVKVMPKVNILLHHTLHHIFEAEYERRMHEYITMYSSNYMIEQYEKSDRFKTIKMLVIESLEAIKQAILFSNMMESFNSYAPEEILYCLSMLRRDKKFVVIRDMIISYEHYSDDVFKLLTQPQNNYPLSVDDINYLVVSHPNFSLGNTNKSSALVNTLRDRIKGNRTGPLALLDDDDALREALKECIMTNGLLNN